MRSVAGAGLIVLLLSGTAIAQSSAAPPAATPAASFGHYAVAPAYDGVDSKSFYVTMRDGVKLAVRVDRPTRGGQVEAAKLPVIWHHSLSVSQQLADGVGEGISATREFPKLVRYGYVIVQVARRGNGQSFGAMRGYHDRNEAQDAFDMIDWLSKQDWSNGKVGMYGCSNTGDATMHALTMRPPALKAAFAGCFSWNKYDAFRRGGVFAQWGTGPTRSIEQDMKVTPVDGDPHKVQLRQAAEQHQQATPLFQMWKELPYRDSFSTLVGSRFWAEGSASSYASQIRMTGIPLYIMGGWHDELRDQAFITNRNIPGSHVVIGPWKHCQNPDFAMLEEMHRFFDRYLKDIDTGIDRDQAIHYYTMNAAPGSEWRSTPVWPLSNTSPTSWFLSDGGRLGQKRVGGGKGVEFTVQYALSCPEAGSGSTVQPCHVNGADPSFTSAPMKAATEVTGNPVADIWIETKAPDANIFLYLEDVGPDGKVTVVTEGRLKASLRKLDKAPWAIPGDYPWHRAFAEDVQPVEPDAPTRLQFDIMPTSWVFRPGHRIQFTVAGADHRERAREELKPAPVVRILTDGRHASQVMLPVIAAGR